MLSKFIKKSKYTVVFTGAGMSTESGLPDFRSSNGMWQDIDPLKLANLEELKENPERFIKFYSSRIRQYLSCKPNMGHEILSRWEKKGLIKSIITQNVDGYHQEAGSKRVIELHGSLDNLYCIECKRKYKKERYLEEKGYYCECGGLIRPNVVLFGELLPKRAVARCERETSKADLFIVLGSSLQVYPANSFPMEAKNNGAKLIIINEGPTDLEDIADVKINRSIGEVLLETEEELKKMEY